MKILTVVGARPQFVKAAVVSRAIAAWNRQAGGKTELSEVLVHTGQHYDENMSAVFFRELEIPPPAHQLAVGSGPHGQQTGRMLESLERVMQQERPDLVLVYGDTNSTLAGALAASKLHIPIAHVEAGLRSYNRAMPEEINRVLVDHVSTLLLCPSERARKNLSQEGITAGVHVAGDVMYDSVLFHLRRGDVEVRCCERLGLTPGSYGVLTLHRAENVDDRSTVEMILAAVESLNLPIVFPIHPRTKAMLDRVPLRWPPHVRATEPLPYLEMLQLMRDAKIVLTDSGGLQKEALFLKVPCVTLRHETEWVETVEAGWNRLAGTEHDRIVSSCRDVLAQALNEAPRPYGNGRAGETVVDIVAGYLGTKR
ncbi:MAG: UDP-N-acetylglucosamine 2-epimerase (non-hydrolyzing) [Nitrospiraceae bacterium]|nr:UDP-N-acetylglucosamine 2-epimerase (non-hydrolyzing) [Nitrospiraceae bacterium]